MAQGKADQADETSRLRCIFDSYTRVMTDFPQPCQDQAELIVTLLHFNCKENLSIYITTHIHEKVWGCVGFEGHHVHRYNLACDSLTIVPRSWCVSWMKVEAISKMDFRLHLLLGMGVVYVQLWQHNSKIRHYRPTDAAGISTPPQCSLRHKRVHFQSISDCLFD